MDIGPNEEAIHINIATSQDRELIYHIRYEVFSQELGQHLPNSEGILKDKLDEHNIYIVAKKNDAVVGFISITPPDSHQYSIDKYLNRGDLPFDVDGGLFEIRLLTVTKPYRQSMLAFLLMYAAYRYIEMHNGTRIMAIGRLEVLDMYIKGGLIPHGIKIQSGKVTYELVSATMERMLNIRDRFIKLAEKSTKYFVWDMDFPITPDTSCYHGGAFFSSIGNTFDALEKSNFIINADVLDAWFPPSPKVISKLQEYLPWIIRTSPPTLCEGLIKTISEKRNIPCSSILPGAGSSDLMFRALPNLLNKTSRVLLLNPTYGEYRHILENIIHCSVDSFVLSQEENFQVNTIHLLEKIRTGYDMVILVNPNSPTGCYIDRPSMIELLKAIPENTKVWIDETYIEYVGKENSLERFTSTSNNIIVCKSMSKVYALSGMRVAYLCSGFSLISKLMAKTPPWVIGLPSQIAAVEALNDPEYYQLQYELTHKYRKELVDDLTKLEIGTVFSGNINCVLIQLEHRFSAKNIISDCIDRNLYIRDATPMGSFKTDVIRITVKDQATNRKIVEVLKDVTPNLF